MLGELLLLFGWLLLGLSRLFLVEELLDDVGLGQVLS